MINELFHAVFDASALALLGSAVGLATLTYALALGGLSYFHRRTARVVDSVPVATFMTGVATVWALSVGFVAADVWTVWERAGAAAVHERSALTELVAFTSPAALNDTPLREALSAYERAVRADEWGAHGSRTPAPDVVNATQKIRVAIIAIGRSGNPSLMVGQLWKTFDDLQDARDTRLAIGMDKSVGYKWLLVLMLTAMSQLAIAAVHADRPAAGVTALAVYTVAAFLSLWILSLHANPYSGDVAISFPLLPI